jgi:hypothetical protein
MDYVSSYKSEEFRQVMPRGVDAKYFIKPKTGRGQPPETHRDRQNHKGRKKASWLGIRSRRRFIISHLTTLIGEFNG